MSYSRSLIPQAKNDTLNNFFQFRAYSSAATQLQI